jgi:hypothetical protein
MIGRVEEAPPLADELDLTARVPRTQFVMLVAALGVFIGPAIVLADRLSWSPATRSLARSEAFQLWVGTLAAGTMFWTVALPPVTASFLRHWRARDRPARDEVLPSAAVLVLFVAAVAVTPRIVEPLPPFMPHEQLKIALVTSIALATGLVASMSIWLVRGRLRGLCEQPPGREQLQECLRLRTDLERLLAFLGATIGLAVFASAALRQVALEYSSRHPSEHVAFSPAAVVVYGFVLTLLVALIYVPTHATYEHAVSRFRDELEPFPDPRSPDFDARVARRAALDRLLGLDVSAAGSFRAGVAILTPLLASLTSLLPGLGG